MWIEQFCNYCGYSDFVELTKQVDIRYLPQDEFKICKCENCGILFTTPNMTTEKLNKHYPGSYGAYDPLGKIDFFIYLELTWILTRMYLMVN